MKTDLIKRFAEVDAEVKALEAERTKVKHELLEAMEAEGVTKSETSYGTVTRAAKKVWTYSEKVKTMADKMKALQAKEQQKGTATASESVYLVFTSPKAHE